MPPQKITGGGGMDGRDNSEKGLSAIGGMLLVSTVIITLAALSWGELVFAPAAFAVFTVMVVWPLQAWLQARMPRMLAMLLTIVATLVCVGLLLVLFAWGISVIG